MRIMNTVDAVNNRCIKGDSPLFYIGSSATKAFSLMAFCVKFFSIPTIALSSPQKVLGPDFDNYQKCL